MKSAQLTPDPRTDSAQHQRATPRWRRLLSGNPTEGQLGLLLLLPALITLAVVMLYPVLNVLWQSLHFERLNQPMRGTPFIWLDNFKKMLWGREMGWSIQNLYLWRLGLLAGLAPVWLGYRRRSLNLTAALALTLALGAVALWLLGYHPVEGARMNDPRFWNSFKITLLIMAVSVTGAFLVGLPLALLANVHHPLKWLVRLAMLLPWVMPRVFTGLAFAWLFQADYGVVNDLLGRAGINSLLEQFLPAAWTGRNGVFWLSRDVPAIFAVNVAIIWKTSSFVGLLLLAGLQSIDDSLYEAATIDGAGSWQRFWHVTLPLLRPAIVVALIFRTLTAIQTFDEPFAMTQGGPGRTLETLGVYIYKTVNGLDIGYAAALAVSLFALSLLISIVYLRWIYTDD